MPVRRASIGPRGRLQEVSMLRDQPSICLVVRAETWLWSALVAGSYATGGSEPRQVRKEATVGAQHVCCRVPGDHPYSAPSKNGSECRAFSPPAQGQSP